MKEFLSRRGFAYTQRDILHDAGAKEELQRLGIKEVPTTSIGRRYVTGYRPRELAQLLGIPLVRSGARGQQELLDNLFAVLAATHRYAQAIPEAQIQFISPDPAHRISDRPLSGFSYHIFRIVDLALDTMETGHMPPDLDGIFRREAPAFTTVRSITDFAAGVLDRLREWTEQPKDWSRQVDGGVYGPTSVEDLWRVMANHSGHHLRQFAVLLQECGAGAPEPLPKELDRLELPASFWG